MKQTFSKYHGCACHCSTPCFYCILCDHQTSPLWFSRLTGFVTFLCLMAHELSTPTTPSVAGGSHPVAQAAQLGASSGNNWGGSSALANSSMASTTSLSPSALQTNNNSYLMPTSPPKSRRGSNDGYRPAVKRSTGNPPACLVNASVTYCGNNQIYAFGGFDQYTDEG